MTFEKEANSSSSQTGLIYVTVSFSCLCIIRHTAWRPSLFSVCLNQDKAKLEKSRAYVWIGSSNRLALGQRELVGSSRMPPILRSCNYPQHHTISVAVVLQKRCESVTVGIL